MFLNKVFIGGNLTKDPELTTMPNGTVICKFSVATNETYNNKTTGEKVQTVEYHNIVSFGKQAEVITKFFTKGQSIFIEGKLKTSSWEDKDTQKKMYRTEIFLSEFQFNGSKATPKQPSGDDYPEDTNGALDAMENKQGIYSDLVDDINPKDIPF